MVELNGRRLGPETDEQAFAKALSGLPRPFSIGFRKPQDTSMATFGEGPLGLGVMRRPGKGIVVSKVVPGQQAEQHGLKVR